MLERSRLATIGKKVFSRWLGARRYPQNGLELACLLKRLDIQDERVLAAIADVPRDQFVSEDLQWLAWHNDPLPIGCGQTISQPFIVAYMSQMLELEESQNVLEIGTGSGYQTAVLSQLCRHVSTIERYPDLYRMAVARFAQLGLENISAKIGDGYEGWPENAPYDRIIITAAAPEVPKELIGQLKMGGRMLLPLGERPVDQFLTLFERTESGQGMKTLLPVRFVPMVKGKVL